MVILAYFLYTSCILTSLITSFIPTTSTSQVSCSVRSISLRLYAERSCRQALPQKLHSNSATHLAPGWLTGAKVRGMIIIVLSRRCCEAVWIKDICLEYHPCSDLRRLGEKTILREIIDWSIALHDTISAPSGGLYSSLSR